MGNSSQKAAAFLRENGFTDVKDIIGDITEWTTTCDKTMSKY